ncbi:MAG: hypothetical protein WCJ30_00340 [Deltaproteobacteria bacterium]
MPTPDDRRPALATLMALLAAAVAFGAIVFLAPAERQLGSGIRVVYVHVPLVWTGMLALVSAAIAGAFALARPRGPSSSAADAWGGALGMVGVVSYGAGVAMSLLAARINWGTLLWIEPRLAMSLRVVGLALAVQFVAPRLESVRARGAARLAVAVFMLWSLYATPLYVHPRDPIGTSAAWQIRGAFYSLFAILALTGAWAATQLRMRARVED